jgi:predicted deacylase
MIARLAALVLFMAWLIVPTSAEARTGAVLDTRVIGYSVQHRKIVAYHLGDPHARPVMVLLGEMHGDEHAGVVVARSVLKYASRLHGVNLWVIPTMNPDGDAAHTRKNAHHVDLNRNWPYHWRHLTGQYNSGPHPLSEPETRAVRRFLLDVHPRFVASLHQPLHGVDVDASSGERYRHFRNALSRNLGLPIKNFDCWSVCYGSLSSWFHARKVGNAVETVEFGWHPARAYLTARVRRGIIAAMGGHFGSR